jgi:hypothetical protein
MNPCLRYLADGVPQALWLAPTERVVVDLEAPGLAHALEIARTAGGTGIRLEFHQPGVPGKPAMTVHIP